MLLFRKFCRLLYVILLINGFCTTRIPNRNIVMIDVVRQVIRVRRSYFLIRDEIRNVIVGDYPCIENKILVIYFSSIANSPKKNV